MTSHRGVPLGWWFPQGRRFSLVICVFLRRVRFDGQWCCVILLPLRCKRSSRCVCFPFVTPICNGKPFDERELITWFVCLYYQLAADMEVSWNGGTPKLMVFKGESHYMDDLEVPPFMETSIYRIYLPQTRHLSYWFHCMSSYFFRLRWHKYTRMN